MDHDTRTVHAFLVAMHPVREALDNLVRCLYQRSEVKIVAAHHPEMIVVPDFGVSAELHNGAVVDFWISLWGEDNGWQMEYSVSRHNPDEDGSHTELDFPPETIHSVSDMPNVLLVAIDRLQKEIATDALFR